MFFPYFTINNKLHPCCCNLNMTEEINGKRLGYFSFFMEKIKIQKEPVRVRINRMTFEIWKKYSKNKNAHNYLFPRTKFGNAISNQKYNSYIKEICKHIGLDRGVRVRDWDLNGKEENTSFIPLYSIRMEVACMIIW